MELFFWFGSIGGGPVLRRLVIHLVSSPFPLPLPVPDVFLLLAGGAAGLLLLGGGLLAAIRPEALFVEGVAAVACCVASFVWKTCSISSANFLMRSVMAFSYPRPLGRSLNRSLFICQKSLIDKRNLLCEIAPALSRCLSH